MTTSSASSWMATTPARSRGEGDEAPQDGPGQGQVLHEAPGRGVG